MVWNAEKDELLCEEVLLFEPFRFKTRTKERGNAWKSIAENLNDSTTHKFKVDARAVRERFSVIRAHYEEKTKEELAASGISPEFTAVDQAIESILEKMGEYEKQMESEDQEKSEKNSAEKKKAEDLRMKAMETFAETKKRKLENGDIGEGGSRVKRHRSSGSDTLVYLREKSEQEFAIRKQESEAKRKDQELQATQLKCMQEQQQQMMSTLTEQLNQQQQQNQQVMMLMLQMLQNKK